MAAVPDRAVLWVTFPTNDEAKIYRYINSDGLAKHMNRSEDQVPLTSWLQKDWSIVDVRFDTARDTSATVLLVERIVRP